MLAPAPDDPLNQEAASFHNYMGKSCDNVDCWNSEIAPVAADVPVVTGEFAQDVCGPSNFDDEYMSWADAHGVGYLAWAWVVLTQQEIADEGCSAYYLISDYSGAPASPNGTILHGHLLTLPPGGVTLAANPPTTTVNTPAGGAGSGGQQAQTQQKPLIALTAFHVKVAAGGAAIDFQLGAAESCQGTLKGETAKGFLAGSKGHKPRKVSLGGVNFRLVAGKTRSVILRLTAASRQLLATRHSLATHFTLTLSGPQSRPTVLERAVTLTEPGSRRHPS
ncbi:MAG: sle [Solirubrobacterales bacterium]|nr:sle [Solirubrobacterales bacterium]